MANFLMPGKGEKDSKEKPTAGPVRGDRSMRARPSHRASVPMLVSKWNNALLRKKIFHNSGNFSANGCPCANP
jgi:hypothetical protein